MLDRYFLVAILCWLGLVVQQSATAEDQPKKGQKVFVEVCVAEVSLSKLRALGFDWSALSTESFFDGTDGEQQGLLSFVDALAKDDLARICCRPQITTLSGRTASFKVGDEEQWTRLELVPEVLDTQKIQLQFRIDLKPHKPAAGQPNATGNAPRQLVLDTATELEPGKTSCISETRTRKNVDGKTVETATVILVRADIKLPSDDSEAARRLPAKGYQEVPQRR